MKRMLAVSFFLVSVLFIHGQKTHLSVGLVSAANQTETITPQETGHYGYKAGIDSRLIGKGLYVLGGIHYLNYSSAGQPERDFFNKESSFKILKGRIGLGLTPFALTRFLKIRLKVLGGYSYILAGRSESGIQDLGKDYLGLDLGIGATIGLLTIDLEYEKSTKGVIEGLTKSGFNIWSLSAGIEF